MAKVIDYYFSLNSPWTYLGSLELEKIAERHGAEIRVKPVSLGQIFPKTGGLPLPKRAPERQAYRLVELARWPAFRDLPLNPHPKFFPADETLAAGCVIAAGYESGAALRLAHGILRAVWAEDHNIADEATLADIVRASGADAEALFAQARAPGTAQTYRAQTEEALARGVFGAPSYIYKDELFWGQDRLDFLDRALAR